MANLKQKPVPVQWEEEEESSIQEKSDDEDPENSNTEEGGSSSEEQKHNELDNDEASENGNNNQVPFRIRIIPMKQKKTFQKAGPCMIFLSTCELSHK